MNKLIAFVVCAFVLMAAGYYGQGYLVDQEKAAVQQVAAPKEIKDESPIFSPGQCVGEKIEDDKHYEAWEQKPTVKPEFRIEAVGQERYRLRYVDNNCCELVEKGMFGSGPKSWTTISFIDRKYILVDCPNRVKNVPLAEQPDANTK